jgi:EAL domain-containing protein (putative c-di-GMP-specific phosphodiesterase class I)/CheY-like chemotaxis protein
MDHAAGERLSLHADLAEAASAGQLRLLYQPVLDLAEGTLRGGEALVRWQHPTLGLLTPDRFIGLAEDTGLIGTIGKWVLDEACREASSWPDEVAIAVNVSPRQLDDPTIVTEVADALARSGIQPARLILEITESVLAHDTTTVVPRLHELRALGVRIAVDDFGTGYSSLLYLRRFPVTILKLDRFFVSGLGRDADDAAIVKSTIDLAHALGITALAEGVEQQEQLEILLDMGCDLAQGYLWSPPVPPDDLTPLLEQRTLASSTTATTERLFSGERGMDSDASTQWLARKAPRLRVVLVDDSAGDRSLLRSALEAQGAFDVIGEAGMAEDAIAMVRNALPDVVVLDLSMPGRNGLETLPEILLASPRTRVVVLTGYTSEGVRRAAVAAGASACLNKSGPINRLMEELLPVG